MQREEFPYGYVTVEGTGVRTDRPQSLKQVPAVARRYLPEDAAQRFAEAEVRRSPSELALLTVRTDRWLTADLAQKGERQRGTASAPSAWDQETVAG